MSKYDVINKYTKHWTRNSKDQLILWFEGYKPMFMYDCEKELRQFKLCAIAEEFDKVCGKTALTLVERDVYTRDEE